MVLVQPILENLELNLLLELREHCSHMKNKCWQYSHRSLTVNSSFDFSYCEEQSWDGSVISSSYCASTANKSLSFGQ